MAEVRCEDREETENVPISAAEKFEDKKFPGPEKKAFSVFEFAFDAVVVLIVESLFKLGEDLDFVVGCDLGEVEIDLLEVEVVQIQQPDQGDGKGDQEQLEPEETFFLGEGLMELD